MALACDDQELPGLDDGAGQVIFCLQRFHGDAETLGDFLECVPSAYAIPSPAIGFDALYFDCRERRKFI